MNDLGQKFDLCIAAIHGSGSPGAEPSASGAESRDIRHEEFEAMADVFLGEDYDKARLHQVEDLQIVLHQQQNVLCSRYERGELDPESYVDAFNSLLDATFADCERILGAEDFQRLFGTTRESLGGFIDKDIFLTAHRHAAQGL